MIVPVDDGNAGHIVRGSSVKTPSQKVRPIKPCSVPTYQKLQSKVCVRHRDVWSVYRPIEKDNQGITVVGTPTSDNGKPKLYSIRQHKITLKTLPRMFDKPRHPNVCDVHFIFCERSTLSFVYEKTDVSLAEISTLTMDPWTVSPLKRDKQLGEIFRQVVGGLQYLHGKLNLAHGEICMDNILLKRNGIVKLANIGNSMLNARNGFTQDFTQDFRSLAEVFDTFKPPPDHHLFIPFQEVTDCFARGALNDSLKYKPIREADSSLLIPLVYTTYVLVQEQKNRDDSDNLGKTSSNPSDCAS